MANILLVSLFVLTYICLYSCTVIKRSVCGENEMEIECAHCGPKRCEDLGYPKKCSGANGICTPECVCIDDYVRNSQGACIMKKECLSCGGDPNAISGCGNHCGNTCSDHRENKTCMTGCGYNGCDCRKGFVFHEKLRKCVEPQICLEF